MAVMSSPRNRCRLGVDNPVDDDGFWEFRKFKGRRKGGAPTGGRLWRRTIRTREAMDVRSEIEMYYADREAEILELVAKDEAWGDGPLAYMDDPMWPANQEEPYDDQPYLGDYEDDLLGCNDDCPSCLAADDNLYAMRRREEAEMDLQDAILADRDREEAYMDYLFGDLP